MNPKETFSLDELIGVLKELNIGFEVLPDENDRFNDSISLDCSIGSEHFLCMLFSDEIGYDHLGVLTNTFVYGDPLRFVNNYNRRHQYVIAYASVDQDDELVIDDEGIAKVTAHSSLMFLGGITRNRVLNYFAILIQELYDFHEAGLRFYDHVQHEVDYLPSMTYLDATVEIEPFLMDAEPKTVVQIMDELQLEKFAVISTLYKYQDRFMKDDSSTPRWTLR